jgi:toxin ParE1/3/4
MHLRWTPAAVADLQHISDYLKEHHPRYRQPTVRKLYEAILGLKKWPQRGRIGREEGTREFLFSPLLMSWSIALLDKALRFYAFITPRRIGRRAHENR